MLKYEKIFSKRLWLYFDEAIITAKVIFSKKKKSLDSGFFRLGDEYGLNCKVYDRTVDGEYTLAKLLEHSWWRNPFVNAFSENLYEEPGRVCWVGDYADEPEDFCFSNCSAFYVPCYRAIWGDKVKLQTILSTGFTLDEKFLVNYDTKE